MEPDNHTLLSRLQNHLFLAVFSGIFSLAAMAHNENRNVYGSPARYHARVSTQLHPEYDCLQTRIFKIIVIGDSNVGKTCLSYRFCGGKFLQNPEATIGVDFRERTVEIEGEKIKIQIWDTAGQERFRKSMVEHYYRNVHAIVFVYDITKLSTFESLPDWIEECARHSVSPSVPRIMVGNKCDLTDTCQISTSSAQRLADNYNLPLFETSAKDPTEKEHVDAIFMTLAYKLKNHKPLRLKQLPRESSMVHLSQEEDAQSPCLC